MKYTVCDRCASEFKDTYKAIKLTDKMQKGECNIKFNITLNTQHTSQVIKTKTVSENISADICPNCVVELLLKDIIKNFNYNN